MRNEFYKSYTQAFVYFGLVGNKGIIFIYICIYIGFSFRVEG